MLDQDKILHFLKVTGPTLPTKVAKNIGTNSLLASAHLSDLASQRKIKVSNLKIGGSPLYYLPGQEDQLYNFAAGNINPKNLDVLEKLKDRKVLKEADLELLEKVALRSLKDFAVPLHVVQGQQRELFWKWHQLTDAETNQAVTKYYHVVVPEEENIEVEESSAVEEAPVEIEVKQAPKVTLEPKEPVKQASKVAPEPKQEPKQEPVKENKIPSLSDLQEEQKLQEQKKQELEDKESEAKELLEEEKVTETAKQVIETSKKEQQKQLTEKKPLLKKLREKIQQKKTPVPDTFLPTIKEFFSQHNIMLEEHSIVRKNSEIDLFIKIPSTLGHTLYFCKAKKKKKCDDKDLSSAYMEAQIKKLPLLLLHTGEMHKKAQEMLDSGVFQNVLTKQIEHE
ncbi:hypothetical protein HOI26_01665 [Candidatus Woesearchaeota archaeon]|jgi:hypothetical protein|nr:hypothetical protein [Candidatus Woesearchaeota archaeon]MBT5739783.1 hypothetical protein [Candidatus Woesearchaeota archaeon]